MSVPKEDYVQECDRHFLLDYYKSKIGEHITYWLTSSIILLTIQQLNLLWLFFVIALVFYFGFNIYVLGRMLYWETFSSYLMGLPKYKILEDGNEYTTLDLIQYAMQEKMEKPDIKHSDTIRRKFGRIFRKINTLVVIFGACLIASLVILLYGCYAKIF